jgi:ubiquinone/menaquinone biosynthesis C-methylase UbiE
MTAEAAHRKNLDAIVSDEAFLWGDDVFEAYHLPAEADMHRQWATQIWPLLSKHNIDYAHSVDLACGHGRNTAMLSPLSQKVTLVDVNGENIEFCKQRFRGDRYAFVQTSGYDLKDIGDGSVSFVYSFDAMVHFDLAIVYAYVKEFARILQPGGYGFIHHSNCPEAFGKDFRDVQGWRNFNSREVFAGLCQRFGLEVVEQQLLDWGPKDHDCFTVFRKPLVAVKITPGAVEGYWSAVTEAARASATQQAAKQKDELAKSQERVRELEAQLAAAREQSQHAQERAAEAERKLQQPLPWLGLQVTGVLRVAKQQAETLARQIQSRSGS